MTEEAIQVESIGWTRSAKIAQVSATTLRRAVTRGVIAPLRQIVNANGSKAYVFSVDMLKNLRSSGRLLLVPKEIESAKAQSERREDLTEVAKVQPVTALDLQQIVVGRQIDLLIAQRAKIVRGIEMLQKEITEILQPYREQHQRRESTKTEREARSAYYESLRRLLPPGSRIGLSTLKILGLAPALWKHPSEQAVRTVTSLVLAVLELETLVAQTAHPDLVCMYKGEVIGVEVEVKLEDYNLHLHDAAEAHVVACWEEPDLSKLVRLDENGLFFRAENCTPGYSPLLAVLSIQTVSLLGNPLAVGHKRVVLK